MNNIMISLLRIVSSNNKLFSHMDFRSCVSNILIQVNIVVKLLKKNRKMKV